MNPLRIPGAAREAKQRTSWISHDEVYESALGQSRCPAMRDLTTFDMGDPKISMFRPWRDTRFSEDKSPLKTHVAATFPYRALGRMNGAGLYFEVAPRWVWIGGGVYAPDTAQLQALRAIDFFLQ